MRSLVQKPSPLMSLPILFMVSRFILIISLPLEGLRGFGDLGHFFRLAGMGRPFIDYWVEFPPLFPFLSSFLHRLSGGREHVFVTLLVLLLSLAQAGCLHLFIRLAQRTQTEESARQRSWIFFSMLLVLPYGWWYFDPFVVLATLLGLYWLLAGKDGRAALALAAGVLIKLFPVLALGLVWRIRPLRRAAWITSIILVAVVLVYGCLYWISPDFTLASLRSQTSKGSWESFWALLDGNLNTGNFGPLDERYDAATAGLLRGNPSRLPAGLTLIPFAFLGGWIFWRARIIKEESAIAFLGLIWCLFFLWSPGWSPQWVLYLLPFILLALPERSGILFALALVLVNLLEWPVLLSRGYFSGLWATIPARTLLFILLSVEFWKAVRVTPAQKLAAELNWKISEQR